MCLPQADHCDGVTGPRDARLLRRGEDHQSRAADKAGGMRDRPRILYSPFSMRMIEKVHCLFSLTVAIRIYAHSQVRMIIEELFAFKETIIMFPHCRIAQRPFQVP